jgi:hypothetical protein
MIFAFGMFFARAAHGLFHLALGFGGYGAAVEHNGVLQTRRRGLLLNDFAFIAV